MEEIIMKLYEFVLFLFNVIKDLVLNVSGKADKTNTSPTNG